MPNLFITSDTHFSHFNAIAHSNRPFRDLEHMDSTLIRNWNARVKPRDQIIIAGDFMFHNSKGGKPGEGTTKTPYDYIDQLNGIKYFTRGNHEKSNFPSIRITGLELKIANRLIWVTHRPQDVRLEYDLNLVGHSHTAFKMRMMNNGYKLVPVYNVGVDVNNFYPQRVIDIISWIDRNKNNEEYYK